MSYGPGFGPSKMRRRLRRSAATALPGTASLAFHFSPEDIAPQADDSTLASWTDHVAGISMSQATGANQPKYRLSRANARPAVQFTGNTWLTLGRPSQLLSALANHNNATGVTLFWVIANVDQGDTGNFRTLWSPHDVNDNYRTLIMSGGRSGLRASGLTLIRPTGGLRIVIARSMTVGAQKTAHLGDNCDFLGTGLDMSAHGSNNYELGAPGNNNAAHGLKADIMEFGCYNRYLGMAEIFTLIKWACDKYGSAYPWAGAAHFDMFDGDSQTYGISATTPSQSWPHILATAKGRTRGGSYSNIAVSGQTSNNLTSNAAINYAGLRAVIGLPIIVHGFEYYNQAESAATGMKAWTAALKAADPGLILAIGSSIDNSKTDFHRDNRAAFNIALAADTHIDLFVPLHTDGFVGVEAACPDDPGPYGTYFADGIHNTDAGYIKIADFWAPYYDAAVALL